ncbi:inner membrane protein [Escherichia coli]|uniref:Inner membrane protein CbrB n=1 Tax=Escherichia coli TaxID=562 RepID=A0A376NXI9_ECOLX|nr:inner membrane protein [Escherichia coli]
MSVSRRVIHHGLYFAVLGPLIGVLFLVLYIFFAKEPLVLLVIIQVLPCFSYCRLLRELFLHC